MRAYLKHNITKILKIINKSSANVSHFINNNILNVCINNQLGTLKFKTFLLLDRFCTNGILEYQYLLAGRQYTY